MVLRSAKSELCILLPVDNEKPFELMELALVGTALPSAVFHNLIVAVPAGSADNTYPAAVHEYGIVT